MGSAHPSSWPCTHLVLTPLQGPFGQYFSSLVCMCLPAGPAVSFVFRGAGCPPCPQPAVELLKLLHPRSPRFTVPGQSERPQTPPQDPSQGSRQAGHTTTVLAGLPPGPPNGATPAAPPQVLTVPHALCPLPRALAPLQAARNPRTLCQGSLGSSSSQEWGGC